MNRYILALLTLALVCPSCGRGGKNKADEATESEEATKTNAENKKKRATGDKADQRVATGNSQSSGRTGQATAVGAGRGHNSGAAEGAVLAGSAGRSGSPVAALNAQDLAPSPIRQSVSGTPKVNLVIDRSASVPIAFQGWDGIDPPVEARAYKDFRYRFSYVKPAPELYLLPGESTLVEKVSELPQAFPLMTKVKRTPLKDLIREYWLGQQRDLRGESMILITDMIDAPSAGEDRLIEARDMGRLLGGLLSGEGGAAALPEEVSLTELWPPDDLPPEAGEPIPLFVLSVVRHPKDSVLAGKVVTEFVESCTDAGWRSETISLGNLGSCVGSVARDGKSAQLTSNCLEISVESLTYNEPRTGHDRSALRRQGDCPTLSVGKVLDAAEANRGSEVAFALTANLSVTASAWKVSKLIVHGGNGNPEDGFKIPQFRAEFRWTGGAAHPSTTAGKYAASGDLLLLNKRQFTPAAGLEQFYVGAALTYASHVSASSEYLKTTHRELVSRVEWFRNVTYAKRGGCTAIRLIGQGVARQIKMLDCSKCFQK